MSSHSRWEKWFLPHLLFRSPPDHLFVQPVRKFMIFRLETRPSSPPGPPALQLVLSGGTKLQAGFCLNQITTLEVQTVAFLSNPYAAGANSCFLNQLLRWWYISTLEAQPYAGGTDAAKPIHSLQSIRWWAPCWNRATNQRVHTWRVGKRHFTGDVSTIIAQHGNLAAKGILVLEYLCDFSSHFV